MSIVSLHRRSSAAATAVIAAATDLDRPTPCTGWNLHALLSHMVGQNHGFAAAITTGDAPRSAYAPRPPEEWAASTEALTRALDAAPQAPSVRLVEISEERLFTVEQAAGFQLFDTVVHTWDVATALGEPFRPDDDLVAATAALARQVPTGAARTRPDAAFAEIRTAADDDDWHAVLALLGRSRPQGPQWWDVPAARPLDRRR